jgi:hypothetical protein
MRPLLLALLLPAAGIVWAQEPPRTDSLIGADIALIDTTGYPSFLRYSAGKLRFDTESDGLQLSRAWFDYRYRLADTVSASVIGEAYDDDVGSTLDLTEAYLEWRPLAATPNRYRLRLGAFYPRISLENVDRGWGSPYTITPSAINTWIGEEFRAFGTEFAVARRPQALDGLHTFSLFGSVFMMNDPAGTLLSWKGWSLHDRQTRFGDQVQLPPVPQIQPGMRFDLQDPFLAPFREIDDALGYYAGGEWTVDRRFMLRVAHYDNHADPESYEDGQFGWHTEFSSIGLQATMPGDIGLIAQWIDGFTVWGWKFGDARLVDAGFRSHFAMLTRRFDRHRLSLRHDRFVVDDNDGFPLDDNSEAGEAWTLAYQFEWRPYLSLAGEWLEVASRRPAWDYFGFDEKNTETQLQLQLRLRFTL